MFLLFLFCKRGVGVATAGIWQRQGWWRGGQPLGPGSCRHKEPFLQDTGSGGVPGSYQVQGEGCPLS